MANIVENFTNYRIRSIEIAEAEYYETLIRTLDKIETDVVNLVKAMRYSAREYEKYKQSLIERSKTVSLDADIDANLDELIALINANKNDSMAFAGTDMIGYSNDKTVNSYTVVDSQIVNYPISQKHNLNTLSKRAVYVYLNKIQLIHGSDYEFTDITDSSNQHGVEIKVQLSTNDVIKIVELDPEMTIETEVLLLKVSINIIKI